MNNLDDAVNPLATEESNLGGDANNHAAEARQCGESSHRWGESSR